MTTSNHPTPTQLKELELKALLEVTEAINNNLPVTSLYKIYHFTLLANLKVKKLALFVIEESGWWNCPVHFGTDTPDSHRRIRLQDFEKLKQSQRLQREQDVEFDLVIPVYHKGKVLALLFVGDVTHAASASTTFLEVLTNIVLVAIENKKIAKKQQEQEATKRELEIAHQVQHYLFPKHLPCEDDLEVAVTYLPHRSVGGDYYDYVAIDSDLMMFCIADVSGKGIPAALMVSNLQASLRMLIRQTHDLKKVAKELNHQMLLSGNGELFVTFFIALYHRKTKIFRYLNCGHHPPLMSANGRAWKELSVGSTVLGMFHPLPLIEVGSFRKVNDFALFGYTDGLSEAANPHGEEFGETNILEWLNHSKGKKAAEVNEAILHAANRFRVNQRYRDDVTLLSVKYNGE